MPVECNSHVAERGSTLFALHSSSVRMSDAGSQEQNLVSKTLIAPLRLDRLCSFTQDLQVT
jgi:hypothetical protein